MIEKTRSVLKNLIIIGNICTVIAFLSVCLVPFINTGKYWYFAFPGLVFPLIFFALVCFIVLLTIFRSKWVWVSIIALLIGGQQIISVFAFHLPRTFNSEKEHSNTLRVLQWNVSSWDEDHKRSKEAVQKENYRHEMMELIKDENADVLCLEEFFESENREYFISNIATLQNMGYPYYYFVPTVDFKDDFSSGIAIFSKYPILDSGKYNLEESRIKPKERIGEHLIYTDIKVNEHTFRIFATHLQSVHFDETDYQSLTMLRNAKDPGLNDSKTIISKLKKGYISRYEQADLIEQKINESPYPAVICGDFNDVPNSSTYFKIKGNRKDAFLRKGSFIGRTFRFISPTLRIDYILADKKFKVNQFQTIHVRYSDHYPVETDLLY